MRAYLFDIDGTLIRSAGAGVAALKATLHGEFAAVPADVEIEVAGRTDRAIVRDMFAAHGVENSPRNWQRFLAAYAQRLTETLPQFGGCVLPGVTDLLAALESQDGTVVGLLTGNAAAGARLKLEHYGLSHHFSWGAYGDEHEQRDDIARHAWRRLTDRFDGRIRQDHVWVIGDTPRDVSCARAIGARALAVATGNHSRSQLAACRPDAVLDDLSDTPGVLGLIASS